MAVVQNTTGAIIPSIEQVELNREQLGLLNKQLKNLVVHNRKNLSVAGKVQSAFVNNAAVISSVIKQLIPFNHEFETAFEAIQVVTADRSSARRLVYLNYVRLALASIYLVSIFAFMLSPLGMKVIQDMKDPFSLSFVKQFFTVLKEAIYYLSYFFIKIFPITSQANIAVTAKNLVVAQEAFSFGIDALSIILETYRRENSIPRKLIGGGLAITTRAGVRMGKTVSRLIFANVTHNFVNYISEGGTKSIPQILLDAFIKIDEYQEKFEKHQNKIEKTNYLLTCINIAFNIKGGEAASTPKDVLIGIGLTAFQNINCVIFKAFIGSGVVVASDVARKINALKHKDEMIQYNEMLRANIIQRIKDNPQLFKRLSMGNQYYIRNMIEALTPDQQQLLIQN